MEGMNDTAMNIGMQILGTPPSIPRLQKKQNTTQLETESGSMVISVLSWRNCLNIFHFMLPSSSASRLQLLYIMTKVSHFVS